MRGLLIVALILLIGVTAFALSNPDAATVRFLRWWSWSTTLAMAMIAAFVAGGVLVYVASLVGQRELRARMRAAEGRAREVEGRLRALESTSSAATRPPDETQRLARP